MLQIRLQGVHIGKRIVISIVYYHHFGFGKTVYRQMSRFGKFHLIPGIQHKQQKTYFIFGCTPRLVFYQYIFLSNKPAGVSLQQKQFHHKKIQIHLPAQRSKMFSSSIRFPVAAPPLFQPDGANAFRNTCVRYDIHYIAVVHGGSHTVNFTNHFKGYAIR